MCDPSTSGSDSAELDSMFRLLVQGITDYAIYLLSPEGFVRNWNAGAQRFKGYTAEEIVGQHFSRFYQEEDRLAGLPETALATARREGRFENDGWRLRKDGSRFWAHVIIDLLLDEHGEVLGFAKITRDMTLQREATKRANEQERNFRLLVQGITDYAIYMLSPDGMVSNWNAGAERAKGYKAEEIVGKHFSTFYSPEERRLGLPYRALATALAKGSFEGEGWRHRRDGTRFWAHVIIDPIRDEEGVLVGFAKITRDLTRVKQQMEEVGTVRENLNLALTHMSQGLCFFDSQEKLVLANPRFKELLGLRPGAGEPGSTFTDLLWAQYLQSDEEPEQIAHRVHSDRLAHLAMVRHGHPTPAVEQVWHGKTISVLHRRLPQGGWISTMEDITERKKIETRIVHLASFDSLTELPNRAFLRSQLELQMTNNASCALLCLDLDRFKPVNDAFGYSTGDQVLRIVAHRLRSQLRKMDVAARLGGDEFAVLLPACCARDEARLLADRLIREISRPMSIQGMEIVVGTCVGITYAPMQAGDVDLFLRNANLALYSAKQAGSGCLREYEEGMELHLEEKRSLEKDLRDAIANHEFSLHYQPVINAETNKVITFEALLRWHSPTRGHVSPADFIPLAEETGLMVEIGSWVLATACKQAMTWHEEVGISVNLSPVQFGTSNIVEQIATVLQQTRLDPRRLELELTETAMIRDVEGAKVVLEQLRAMGLCIALDDFGIGYSSLSFLRELPFTRIKIDRSFINDLGRTREALAIIRAITGIGKALEVSVTAEGVETEEQLSMLRAEGCDIIQGYLIQRPNTAERSMEWLHTWQHRSPGKPHLVVKSA